MTLMEGIRDPATRHRQTAIEAAYDHFRVDRQGIFVRHASALHQLGQSLAGDDSARSERADRPNTVVAVRIESAGPLLHQFVQPGGTTGASYGHRSADPTQCRREPNSWR